jgi:hypothetical protein
MIILMGCWNLSPSNMNGVLDFKGIFEEEPEK